MYQLLLVSAVQFSWGTQAFLAVQFSWGTQAFLLFFGHTGLLGLGGYASPPLVSYGQLVFIFERYYLGTN